MVNREKYDDDDGDEDEELNAYLKFLLCNCIR